MIEVIALYLILVLLFAYNRQRITGQGTLNQFIAIDLIFPLYSLIAAYNFIIKRTVGVEIMVIIKLDKSQE
jgi:ACR3 family arsenite efflux pump ArsB